MVKNPSSVKTKTNRCEIMANLIGENLIDFELSYIDTNNKLAKVKLSEEAKNKTILLLFFPAAWTSVCTAELTWVRDSIADFDAVNTRVFGISVDLPWALNMYKKDQNLNITLLSDFNRTTIKEYGVVWPDLAGFKDVALRSAFIIKNGKITYQWVGENQGQMPPFDEIKNNL